MTRGHRHIGGVYCKGTRVNDRECERLLFASIV